MREILKITKAISDPNRLRILQALRGQRLCGCQIIEMLGLAQATVSRHLDLLVDSGLIISSKDGRWKHYRLPGCKDQVPACVRQIIEWVHNQLKNTAQAKQDKKTIKRILTCQRKCK